VLDQKIRRQIEEANVRVGELVLNSWADSQSGQPVRLCDSCAHDDCAVQNRHQEMVVDCGDYVGVFGGSPIMNCAGEEVVSDAMIPRSMFRAHDGPTLARQAASQYSMLPPRMDAIVNNAASFAVVGAVHRGELGANNPGGQYGPPPRVIHSVSELLGSEPEGEEMPEEQGDLVDEFFNPTSAPTDTRKVPIGRRPQDPNLSPRVRKLTRRAVGTDKMDLEGSRRSW